MAAVQPVIDDEGLHFPGAGSPPMEVNGWTSVTDTASLSVWSCRNSVISRQESVAPTKSLVESKRIFSPRPPDPVELVLVPKFKNQPQVGCGIGRLGFG